MVAGSGKYWCLLESVGVCLGVLVFVWECFGTVVPSGIGVSACSCSVKELLNSGKLEERSAFFSVEQELRS